MLTLGIKGKKCLTVKESDTAKAVGSGSLDVFSTPSLIALMENTACESINPFLEDEQTTVGTKISATHLSADPVGVTVMCETVLTEIDGRRLVFDITVKDHDGVISNAEHERFLIKSERFMQNANKKRNDNNNR